MAVIEQVVAREILDSRGKTPAAIISSLHDGKVTFIEEDA